MPIYTNHMYPGWMGRELSPTFYQAVFDAPGCGMFWFKDPQFKPDNPRNVYHVELTGSRARAVLRSIFEKKRYTVTATNRTRLAHTESQDDTDVIEVRHSAEGEFLEFGVFREYYIQSWGAALENHTQYWLSGLNEVPPARVCGGAWRLAFNTDGGPDPATTSLVKFPSILPRVTIGAGDFQQGSGFLAFDGFTNIDDTLTLTQNDLDHAAINYKLQYEHISGPHPFPQSPYGPVEYGPGPNDFTTVLAQGSGIHFRTVGLWMEAADKIHVYMEVECLFDPYMGGYGVGLLKDNPPYNPYPSLPTSPTNFYAEPVTISILGQEVSAWLAHNAYSLYNDGDGPILDNGTTLIHFDLSYDLDITEWWT